jgi:hypothetical protein
MDADRVAELIAQWEQHTEQLRLVEDELERLGITDTKTSEHANCGGMVVNRSDGTYCVKCEATNV